MSFSLPPPAIVDPNGVQLIPTTVLSASLRKKFNNQAIQTNADAARIIYQYGFQYLNPPARLGVDYYDNDEFRVNVVTPFIEGLIQIMSNRGDDQYGEELHGLWRRYRVRSTFHGFDTFKKFLYDYEALIYQYREELGRVQGIQCNICSARANFKCGSCSSALYCGAKCQGKDWDKHQRNCK